MKNNIYLFCFILFASATNNCFGYNWIQRTSAGSREWTAIASSADGMKLVAGDFTHVIMTSSDGGITWTLQTDPSAGNHEFRKIATSADGMRLAGVDVWPAHTFIYTSSDGGVTWVAHTAMTSPTWTSIASSSDGSKLVATDGYGHLYNSIDTGNTWTLRATGTHGWNGLASSSDGMKLTAITNSYYVGGSGDYIYTSTDGGVTWIQRTGVGLRNWHSVASSADGLRIIAAAADATLAISVDGGTTWTFSSIASPSWSDVSSSSDGIRLSYTYYNGFIFTSVNGGLTWVPETSAGSRYWGRIASSADGKKYAATGGLSFEYIYTSSSPNVPYFVNGRALSLTVCENSSATSIDTVLTVADTVASLTKSWILLAGPHHGTAAVSYSTTAADTMLIPAGLTYRPAIGYAGYDTLTVRITDGVLSDTTTVYVTVRSFPAAITGPNSLCSGTSITLTDWNSGGTWTSSNSSATVSGGIVTGVSGGVDTITHTFTNSCGTGIATKVVTINPIPAAITGFTSLCWGSATSLSNSVAGGTWSSSNTTIAIVGSASGLFAGVGLGSATITYTLPTGCLVTKPVNVESGPPQTLFGCDNIGVGDTLMLTGTSYPYLGFFSSSNPAVALAMGYGAVVGMSIGTATINEYSGTTGCLLLTKNITVTPTTLIHPVTGADGVCLGANTTLADVNPGGTWTSSNPSVASIGSSGVVSGISAGYAFITYTVPGASCPYGAFTVYAPPVVTGPTSVCAGDSASLDGSGLYVYLMWDVGFYNASFTSSDTNVFKLYPEYSNSSDVPCPFKARSAGTAVITFTDLTSGCSTVRTETVNALPASVTLSGPSAVCTGGSITLTPSVTGGTWTRSNTHATVSGGFVTGSSSGVDTITYSVSNVCGTSSASMAVSVSAAPSAGIITGPSSVCVAGTVTLTDASPGGTWSATNGNATVAGGIVTGVSVGIDTIRYTIAACATVSAMKIITVNTVPVAGTILGPTSVCAGASVTLTDASPGGAWSVSNTHATVAGGVVTGITAGVDTIIYSITNACGTVTATQVVTVNPLPVSGAITGSGVVCIGIPDTLTDLAIGGVWSASNAHATVSGGIVTGASAGVDTIIYTVTNVCGTALAVKSVTVNLVPVAGTISGPSMVCVSAAITLTETAGGGIWSSGSTLVATIGSGSGVVTGTGAGSVVISYSITNFCGSAMATDTITVNPLPVAGVISGPPAVCTGSTVTLTDATSGGVWSSSNALAIVMAGVVTGVTSGMDTIGYAVTNVCGTATATHVVTINPLPTPWYMTGGGSFCMGGSGLHLGLGGSVAGTDYQLYLGGTAMGSPVPGTGSAIDFGVFTAAGVYTATALNTTTTCSNNMNGADTINIVTAVAPIVYISAYPGEHISPGTMDTIVATYTGGGGVVSYQWYVNGTIIAGATTNVYISGSFFTGDSVACEILCSGVCVTSGDGHVRITLSGTGVTPILQAGLFSIYPNPNNGEFIIKSSGLADEMMEITVTNIIGEKVQTILSATNKETDITIDGPPGVYLLQAATSCGVWTSRVVVERGR
jgi:Secretion system C-terminal sorting domain